MTERHRKNIQGFLQILSRQETLCASQEQTKTLSYGNHREVRARFFYYLFIIILCVGNVKDTAGVLCLSSPLNTERTVEHPISTYLRQNITHNGILATERNI